jgi:hypothetical protein
MISAATSAIRRLIAPGHPARRAQHCQTGFSSPGPVQRRQRLHQQPGEPPEITWSAQPVFRLQLIRVTEPGDQRAAVTTAQPASPASPPLLFAGLGIFGSPGRAIRRFARPSANVRAACRW